MKNKLISAKIAHLVYNSKNISHLKIFFLLTRYGGQICSESSLGEIIFSANSTRNKVVTILNNLVEMGVVRKTSKGFWQVIGHRVLHKKFNITGNLGLNLGYLSVWLEQEGKANPVELRKALKDNKKILTFLKLAFFQDAVVSCMSKEKKDNRIKKTILGNLKSKSQNIKVKVTEATDTLNGNRPLNSYNVTSTFISSVISSPMSQDFDWGYSSSTIRKHLLRAKKFGFINKVRRTQVIACTQDFKDKTEKFYQKDYIIFSHSTVMTTNVALAALNRQRHNLRFGATPTIQNIQGVEKALFFNQCNSPILSQTDASGTVVALLQEIAPQITFLNDLYRCSNKKKCDKRSKVKIDYKELNSIIDSNLVIDLF